MDDESDGEIGTFGGESVYRYLVGPGIPPLLPGQDWVWRRPIFLEVPVRFSLYNRKVNTGKLLDTVNGDVELSRAFSGCCFGSYLAMGNTGASAARAFSFMMSREIVDKYSSDDELWFRVGGRNIRFGPDDFCLATGLKFGASQYDISAYHPPPDRGIKHRLFGNKKPNLRELLDQFVAGKFGRCRINVGDKLKLAKVLFLYLQLLGVDAHNKVIDPWVWGLIDDEHGWESFPWGSLAHQTLLMHMRAVADVPPKDRLAVYGCTSAFLVSASMHFWFVILIDLKAQELFFMDSMAYKWDDSFTSSRHIVTETLRWVLPRAMLISGFYTDRPEICPVLRQWPIKMIGSSQLFRQKNPQSSGVFALKGVESIIQYQLSSQVSEVWMKDIRSFIGERIFTYNITVHGRQV